MGNPLPSDPRVALAHERTSLALDRTTLAWIRTALTFATFGLGMIGFFRTVHQSDGSERAARLHQFALHFGIVLVAVGALALLIVAWSHQRTVAALRRNELPPAPAVPLAVAMAVLVSLLTLYALWNFLA